MNGLSTTTTIVTGAARGIGLAVVRRLRGEGACAHGVDRDPPTGSGVVPDVIWHRLDVADEHAVEALFAEHLTDPAANVLVNCPGLVEDTPVLTSSLIQWNEMLAFLASREASYVTGTALRVDGGIGLR